MAWWEAAYIDDCPLLAEQFWLEAKSSLPSLSSGDNTLGNLFDAVCLKRMRLKYNSRYRNGIGEKGQVPGQPGERIIV